MGKSHASQYANFGSLHFNLPTQILFLSIVVNTFHNIPKNEKGWKTNGVSNLFNYHINPTIIVSPNPNQYQRSLSHSSNLKLFVSV